MAQLSDTVEFGTVDIDNIHLILPLAKRVWDTTYLNIIGREQIEYMLPMMYSNDRILNEMTEGYEWILVRQEGELIGYLNFKLESDNRVFLSKIYTDVDKQVKGLGQFMLQYVIDYAKRKEAKAVYLTVNKNNQRAIDFYERNGMKCLESKTFDIGNGYVMDDYIYQIEL